MLCCSPAELLKWQTVVWLCVTLVPTLFCTSSFYFLNSWAFLTCLVLFYRACACVLVVGGPLFFTNFTLERRRELRVVVNETSRPLLVKRTDADDASRVRTCWLPDHVASAFENIVDFSFSFKKEKEKKRTSQSSRHLLVLYFKQFLRDRRHHHRRRSGWLCTSTVTRGWLWWALKLWSPSTALVAKVKMNHKNRRARSSLLFFYFYFFKFFISLKMVLKWRVMRLMMCQNPSASATMWPFTTQVDAGH